MPQLALAWQFHCPRLRQGVGVIQGYDLVNRREMRSPINAEEPIIQHAVTPPSAMRKHIAQFSPTPAQTTLATQQGG
jgi:hypothetical protein